MNHATKFIGLDVSKERIAVAVAMQGREEARYWGAIAHTKEALRKLMNQLASEDVTLEVCYEAGPTGYPLYRWLLAMNIPCTVIAPSLIPQRAGDRIKTDKRDALRLAQLFRAGELISVYVPTEADEALRDLVRAREDAKEDLNRNKQRLGKFLLRHQMQPIKEMKTDSSKYEEWLDTLRFEHGGRALAYQEYRYSIREAKERIKRYDLEIQVQADSGNYPLIEAFQALRGVALLSAATLAAEIGSIHRFPHPQQLMCYSGLVPSEDSTGKSRRQGKLTKAGNTHIRRILVESAWSYRHTPGVRRAMRERLEGQSEGIQAISWKAQNRLHKKYKNMNNRGKNHGTTMAAIARELAGYVWAIAKEVDEKNKARVEAS